MRTRGEVLRAIDLLSSALLAAPREDKENVAFVLIQLDILAWFIGETAQPGKDFAELLAQMERTAARYEKHASS